MRLEKSVCVYPSLGLHLLSSLDPDEHVSSSRTCTAHLKKRDQGWSKRTETIYVGYNLEHTEVLQIGTKTPNGEVILHDLFLSFLMPWRSGIVQRSEEQDIPLYKSASCDRLMLPIRFLAASCTCSPVRPRSSFDSIVTARVDSRFTSIGTRRGSQLPKLSPPIPGRRAAVNEVLLGFFPVVFRIFEPCSFSTPRS
jgi:hypothetical protein